METSYDLAQEPRRLPPTFWWALGTALVMPIGAVAPWGTLLGSITFSGTEAGAGWQVIGAAVVAAVGLALYVRLRNGWICLVPLLAAGWAVLVTAVNLCDIGHELAGLETARWGIYVALLCSCSLVLGTLGLALQTRGGSERIALPGSAGAAKLRRPWAVFALSLLTFGLYGLYWYYMANRELKDYGVGKQPVVSLLALFPGGLLIVPPFVSWWRFYSRIREAEDRAESPNNVSHSVGITLYVVAFFLLPFELVYAQEHLNGVWSEVAASTPPSDPFPHTAEYAPAPRTV